MRRAALRVLPALSHWYGLHPRDLDDMTYAEIHAYTSSLRDLPPVGAVFAGAPKK
jgi:hypothetical protein